MAFSWLRHWVGGSARARRRARPELSVEVLEDRLTPSTHTWSGAAGDGLWSDAQNWVEGVAPGVKEVAPINLIFPDTRLGDGPVTQKTNTNDIPGLTVTSLLFTGTGYTLGGNSISLVGTVDDASTAAPPPTILPVNSVQFDVVFQDPVTVQVQDPMRTLLLAGALTGPGGFSKNGAGTVQLTGPTANAYAGATQVNQGTVQLAKRAGTVAIPGPLGIGDGVGGPDADLVSDLASEQIADGARVTMASSGRLDLVTQVVGSITSIASETIGSLDGSGHVDLGAGQLTTGGDNTTTTFGGLISGAGRLVKTGTGTMTLLGNNTYTGTTTVGAGELLVDGSQPGSAVSVNAGATLGGVGAVGATGVAAGGHLAPGGGPGVPGILHVQGALTLFPGAFLDAQLNGTTPGSGYSQVQVSGGVSLGGSTLNLAFGFGLPAGRADTLFTLINNTGPGPINGTFNGLSEGFVFPLAGACAQFTYAGGDGNDAVLTDLGDEHLFVLGVYRDLVRTLQPNGAMVDQLVAALVSGTMDRSHAVRAIWDSHDHHATEVNLFYQSFGQPNDGRQGVYVSQLDQHPGQEGTVLLRFLTSPQFRAHHRSNRQFILTLFRGALGRLPTRRELASLQAQLNRGVLNRLQIAARILSLDETYGLAIQENFHTFLGPGASAGEQLALTATLRRGAVLNAETLTATLLTQDSRFLDRLKGLCAQGQWQDLTR